MRKIDVPAVMYSIEPSLPHARLDVGSPVSIDMGGLLMDLRDLLGLKVDVVTEQGLKPRIRDRVLKEAELL